MYRRLQLDLSQVYIDRTYFDPPYDDSNDNVTTLDLSFIHDNVLWGMTGPVNGSRWKLTWERTVPVTSDSRSYWATELDYRRYWHIKGAYLVALRATGGASFGSDRKTYYLGGTTNYIGSADVGTDVYSVEGFYFSKIVTPLRGYDYFEFSGSKYALINAEFRYPFLDYLAMSFPLPLVISRVSGAIFVDVGSAWTRNSMFKGATSQGGTRLLDIKSGFGIGARLNLGIFLLRYDLGWGTDLDRVSKPHHYFSFGAEF
ncbi:MAG: BamA/TamA family outer membrane protein [candidate division Zixibacteria bacterium]|nr:BamA/TamA family outer membrane protein [candidate division Zixibacteria bacterium]